jgi:hypothetical protein
VPTRAAAKETTLGMAKAGPAGVKDSAGKCYRLITDGYSCWVG